MYPPHIYKLLMTRIRVPFILINGQLIAKGTFLTLEGFRKVIRKHITDTP
jgi:hypothetical protein